MTPYSLDRLFIVSGDETPANSVLTFTSGTAVANYYGASSKEASWASSYFTGPNEAMLFTRIGLRQRPHLIGDNLAGFSLPQLQSISGPLALTFDGYSYSTSVNLASASSLSSAATIIQIALNTNRFIAAKASACTITPETCAFTGSWTGGILTVDSVQSGVFEVGGIVFGQGVNSANSQIIYGHHVVSGPGAYSPFAGEQATPTETMTETYGLLTTGAITSGTVAVGQSVDGPGILTNTAIDSQLDAGAWLVDNAQNFSGDITFRAPTLTVASHHIIGATANRDDFEIQPNGHYGFDADPSDLSFATGAAANCLGLSEYFGAMDSSPGGQHISIDTYMNDILAEDPDFGSFQTGASRSGEVQLLTDWANSPDGAGHTFLGAVANVPPAGWVPPNIVGAFEVFGGLGFESGHDNHGHETYSLTLAVGHAPGASV